MKQRSAVIIVEDDELLLIERVRAGRTYYLFPGGGVEPGETLEQAAIREAREELGLNVQLGPLTAEVIHGSDRQYYFLARVTGGDFGSGDGPEMGSGAESEEGSYRPVSSGNRPPETTTTYAPKSPGHRPLGTGFAGRAKSGLYELRTESFEQRKFKEVEIWAYRLDTICRTRNREKKKTESRRSGLRCRP